MVKRDVALVTHRTRAAERSDEVPNRDGESVEPFEELSQELRVVVFVGFAGVEERRLPTTDLLPQCPCLLFVLAQLFSVAFSELGEVTLL